MESEKIIEILKNEMACVIRADQNRCDRDCSKCDLLRDSAEIIQAYVDAIHCVEAVKDIKNAVSVC